MINIDNMNDSLMMGLIDNRVAEYNDHGWNLIAKISRNHFVGTRIDAFKEIVDDMHKNAMKDDPQSNPVSKIKEHNKHIIR